MNIFHKLKLPVIQIKPEKSHKPNFRIGNYRTGNVFILKNNKLLFTTNILVHIPPPSPDAEAD